MKKSQIKMTKQYIRLKELADNQIRLARKFEDERDEALKENKKLRRIICDIAYSSKDSAIKLARKYADEFGEE